MREITYALITIPLLLIISVAIFGQFAANVDRSGWTAQANQTFERITGQTWAGYNLATLLPFIVIAIIVLGLIVGLLK